MQCIILAAGLSARMGEAKQLMPFKGEPLILHAVNTALKVCSKLIVVQGAAALEQILPEDSRIHLVTNPRYALGRITSLQTALKATDPGPVLVSLGDLALLKAETWAQMYAAGKNASAAYPVCRGRRGHPVLLAPEAQLLIAAAAPGLKAMDVIAPLEPQEIELDDPGIYLDADTPADFAQLERRLSNREA